MYGSVYEVVSYFCLYLWFNWIGWRWFYLLVGRVSGCIMCNVKFR